MNTTVMTPPPAFKRMISMELAPSAASGAIGVGGARLNIGDAVWFRTRGVKVFERGVLSYESHARPMYCWEDTEFPVLVIKNTSTNIIGNEEER